MANCIADSRRNSAPPRGVPQLIRRASLQRTSVNSGFWGRHLARAGVAIRKGKVLQLVQPAWVGGETGSADGNIRDRPLLERIVRRPEALPVGRWEKSVARTI